MAVENDWELLELAGRGDEAAWRILSTRYRPRLIGLAFVITRSRMAAEDVAQESFVRLLFKPPRPAGDSLMPYLSTIAYRLALKEARRAGALQDVAGLDFADPADDPAEEMAGRERREAAARAMNGLSAEHRAVLALHFQGGLSLAEIARLLGIPLGTVKSRLFNAVDNCRKQLLREGMIGDASR